MLSLWHRGALADAYHAHALNTASTTPRGYRAMWSFTSAVQRGEMAIACTGHAHLVTCERYERHRLLLYRYMYTKTLANKIGVST